MGRSLSTYINTWWDGEWWRGSQALSIVPTDWRRDDGDKRKRKHTKSITFHLNISKLGFFCSDGSKTLAQRGCEVPLCGETQNLTGEGPGQAAQAELLDQMILRGPFRFKGFFCVRRKACEEREYLLLGLVGKLENSYFGPHKQY